MPEPDKLIPLSQPNITSAPKGWSEAQTRKAIILDALTGTGVLLGRTTGINLRRELRKVNRQIDQLGGDLDASLAGGSEQIGETVDNKE